MVDVDLDGQISLIPSFETRVVRGGYSPLSWLYEVITTASARTIGAVVTRRVPDG